MSEQNMVLYGTVITSILGFFAVQGGQLAVALRCSGLHNEPWKKNKNMMFWLFVSSGEKRQELRGFKFSEVFFFDNLIDGVFVLMLFEGPTDTDGEFLFLNCRASSLRFERLWTMYKALQNIFLTYTYICIHYTYMDGIYTLSFRCFLLPFIVQAVQAC